MDDFIAGLKEFALWFLLPTFAFAFALGLSEAITNLFKKKEKEYIHFTVVGTPGKEYPDLYYQKIAELKEKHGIPTAKNK